LGWKEKIMKTSRLLPVLLSLALLSTCTKEKGGRVTLPEIDISTSPNGIVPLPADIPAVFKKYFGKYTKVVAPNGKPIHILAQDGWTDDQIKHGRNVLEHILTSYPGSAYGDDKSAVANSMADKKATMVFFNTQPDLRKAFEEGLGDTTDLSIQDLRANESPAVGDDDYMNHVTRDAAYEEIWHLVHDYGIKPTLPDMIAEMRKANDAAAENGWRGWPDDEPEEHPNEYVGVLIDNYYDLWATHPTKYEGRAIEAGRIPEGHSHFGRYFANSRSKQKAEDPLGYAVIEKFFHPYLTYTPELPESFAGTFSMTLDESKAYTFKTQHLVKVTLTGANDANLTGNAYDNTLTGNAGNNILKGVGGNDQLFGGEGEDTAVFTGAYSQYSVTTEGESTTVEDRRSNRDGIDTLDGIEVLQFADQKVHLNRSSRK
jgi:hypothetical protein